MQMMCTCVLCRYRVTKNKQMKTQCYEITCRTQGILWGKQLCRKPQQMLHMYLRASWNRKWHLQKSRCIFNAAEICFTLHCPCNIIHAVSDQFVNNIISASIKNLISFLFKISLQIFTEGLSASVPFMVLI